MKHFVNPPESYVRDYQLVPTYIEDNALYLHKQTGQPIERCRQYVREAIAPGGQFALRIPNALVLVRDKNGDRHTQEMPFDQWLDSVRERREILSPSLTSYMHPDQRESVLAQYIGGNLKLRKKAKHAKFVAELKGDLLATAIQESMQTTYKIKNNSLSGAHCSPYTILWNKSSHSTLTSTCRTATSYANANNEKFLYGNRHYYAPDIVKANIVSIVNHSDLVKMQAVMDRHHISPPTVEQVMSCIVRSTEAYWRSPTQMALIENLVRALDPIQRAAFLFTSDFYHLAEVNPNFVRQFLTDMSMKETEPLPAAEVEMWMDKLDDNLKAFVGMLCANEIGVGRSLGDADGKGTKLKDLRWDDYARVAATVKKIILTLDHYEDFIRVFWVTDNLPSSVYYMPNIIRRGAITSDTDSTIFTVQHWTEWYVGKLDFSETSMAVASTMVYFSGQLIRHILATLSGNMGVAQKNITLLSMKNEYYFPVFVLTSRAKHYYAYISAQEGNVFKALKTEIKGVALRNSNVPVFITEKAHAMMRFLMDQIMAGKKISIKQVMAEIAAVEKGIRDSVEQGSYDLMPRLQIKGMSSYKDASKSNYVHYDMWEEVFANKYGHAPSPPYSAIKVSIDADNPTKLKRWLDSMEDQVIANKMREWLQKTGRKAVSQLLLPEMVLSMSGVPKEIILGVNIRGLIFQMMEAYYLILESLGIYMRNDNITRLVSDNGWLLENHLTQHLE